MGMYICIYIYIYIHEGHWRIWMTRNAYLCARTHTYKHTHTHTHTYSRTITTMKTKKSQSTYTQTTHIHTYVQVYINTHTHTYIQSHDHHDEDKEITNDVHAENNAPKTPSRFLPRPGFAFPTCSPASPLSIFLPSEKKQRMRVRTMDNIGEVRGICVCMYVCVCVYVQAENACTHYG
jgi:hypothetical protein